MAGTHSTPCRPQVAQKLSQPPGQLSHGGSLHDTYPLPQLSNAQGQFAKLQALMVQPCRSQEGLGEAGGRILAASTRASAGPSRRKQSQASAVCFGLGMA